MYSSVVYIETRSHYEVVLMCVKKQPEKRSFHSCFYG